MDPVNFVDPTGFYLESLADAVFLTMDVYDIVHNPSNGWAWASLGADLGCLLLPGATGGRLGVKTLEAATKEGNVIKSSLKLDLQFFASKSDIKQIEAVAKEFKMNSQQRRAFGDYIESLKDIVPNNKNFSYKELKQYAEEFLEEF